MKPCQCGEPATDRLSIAYRYSRPEPIPEAADPWHVQGGTSMFTCGSPACEASAMLAAVDEVIVNSAVHHGHLLSPEDVQIIHIGHPGDNAGIKIVGQ